MNGSKLGNQIAASLLGKEATRLVMVKDKPSGGYQNLGGWCKEAVVALIDLNLKEIRQQLEIGKVKRVGKTK